MVGMLHTWLPSERGARDAECRVSVFDIEHDMVPPSGGAIFFYFVTPDSARSRWRELAREARLRVVGRLAYRFPDTPSRLRRQPPDAICDVRFAHCYG